MNECSTTEVQGQTVRYIGDSDLLQCQATGLFCSRKCPADKILDAVERFKKLAKEKRTVISGFHSPVEKECLKILLRSSGHAIVCPARGIGNMRIPSEWKHPIAKGSLLVISEFDDSIRRSTTITCQQRNEFIASLADELVVIHAEPGSKIETFLK